MPGARLPARFDETTDVVVIGCGYAGAMAAIAAHDAGARVLVLEKMPDPGGISICSAGGVRVADDPGEALAYLEATNAGTTPTPVLRALAHGMTRLPAEIDALARQSDARVSRRPAAGNYPLPGHRTFGFAHVEDIPGFDPAVAYPQVEGSPAGARLFRVVEDNLRARAIEIRLATPAERLIVDPHGRVRGVIAWGRAIGARRAVILACGGFEGSPELQRQYWQAKPVLSAAFRGNTGDGIRMAQDVGASLWHMWHFHGAYGFCHPDPKFPFAIRTKRLPDWLPGEGPPPDVRMPWILLDRTGRRFMNEYEPYLQDTGARPLERYHPESQSYPALPAWLVADEDGRRLYPFGRPTWHERGVSYRWSADNRREIELGILRTADDLTSLARGLGVEEARLAATLAAWNEACASGRDERGRPPTSMLKVERPPFVYAPVWPVVSNTQGGPAHDERQRVLGAFDQPIPRLYACGECGSVFGHLYMSGGNLAECFVGGRIAGEHAAAQQPCLG